MYELNKNSIQLVEHIKTSKQTAIVKSTITNVKGYDGEDILLFESLPEKQEYDGITELHYINGELQWVYLPNPPTEIELAIDEYTLSLIEMGVL